MTASTTVAVIVPVAGRDDHLRRLLTALDRQIRRPDEVVVADMADARPVLATASTAVRRIAIPTGDRGWPLAAARNRAAAATDADVLVFLDADCLPDPALIADYLVGLATAPDVLACGRVRYLCEGWDEGRRLDEQSHHLPARPLVATATVDDDHPDLFWSLNFATRASTWASLGGFDEGYAGYGAEDTDFGRRAQAAGVPLLWLPGALAYHQWHPPTRLDPERAPELVANARRFHTRWGVWPMAGWLTELAADGLVEFDPAHDVLELAR